MKLEPVTRLNKKNKAASKSLTMTSCQQSVTPLTFFQFMVNSKQSGSWISDAYSTKLTFFLVTILYLAQTENRTKISLTQISHCSLFLLKNTNFLPKKANISKIKRVLVLQGIFPKTTYECAFTFYFLF